MLHGKCFYCVALCDSLKKTHMILFISNVCVSIYVADPRFVGVHLIPESDNPEDDKIYLFFRENAMDGEHAGKATHARIGQLCKVRVYSATCPSKHTLTHTSSCKGKFRHTQKETHTLTPALCEIASVCGKTLDGCLSGFHYGSFQKLLSVIIFSPEKSGLCCAWYNRPQRQKPERNVKCHQNLRGKDAVNGSTVILMPGFGTDWSCYTLQLQGMVILNRWPCISFHIPNPICIY